MGSCAQSVYLREDWLQANAAGQVTPDQLDMLKKSVRILARILWGAFLMCNFATYPLMYTSFGFRIPPALVAFVFLGSMGIGGYLGFASGWTLHKRLLAEATSGSVACNPGRVRGSLMGSTAEADEQRLRALKPLKLPPGEYQFYYLPQAGILLSARPANGAEAPRTSLPTQNG